MLFNILFDHPAIVYSSGVGCKPKNKESKRRPGLDADKKNAILGKKHKISKKNIILNVFSPLPDILHMAGYEEWTLRDLNNFLNTYLSNLRDQRTISQIYDGSKDKELEEYNKRERKLARNRLRAYNNADH